MELLINGASVDLFENQEVVVQLHSPLTSFQLQGDKTYSFNVPNSDALKKQIGHAGHLQNVGVGEIIGELRASGRRVIKGKTRKRKANDRAVTMDMIVPPAMMDASWWNGSASGLDLGSDTLLTQEETTNILLVKYDHVLEDFTSSGGLKVTIADALQYRGPFRLSFFDGSTQLFSTIFKADYGNAKRDLTAWVSEAQYAFDEASSETMYFYASETQISVMREGMNPLNFKFRIENLNASGQVSYTYEVGAFQAVKYLSVWPGTRKAVLIDKPYFFTTLVAKNFYGEKVGRLLTLNYKIDGELQLNTQSERTSYPLVPCFRWKFIFEKLATLMGLSLEDADWLLWKDLAFCSMIDLAEQCPTIDMPFNVYQNRLNYADFLPVGFAVKDVFEEFGLLTGTSWSFDMLNMKLRLIQIDELFDKKPIIIADDKLDLRDGINYEDVVVNKLNYSSVIEAEKLIAPVGYFDDKPTLGEGYQLMNLKLLPILPVKLFGTVIGGQCLSVGKSVFFDLKEQTPAARVFWYNAELERALTDMNGVSLSRTDANGLYERLWRRILLGKKGKKLTAKGLLSLSEFLKLDMFALLQYRGVRFLINQLQLKLRHKATVHEVEIELEIIS